MSKTNDEITKELLFKYKEKYYDTFGLCQMYPHPDKPDTWIIVKEKDNVIKKDIQESS